MHGMSHTVCVVNAQSQLLWVDTTAGAPLGTILNFLLQLGFRDVGSPFALADLDSVQHNIAADMAQLGLIMPFR